MARAKKALGGTQKTTASKELTKKKAEVKKYICTNCDTEKRSTDFYVSRATASGVLPFCKECIINKSLDHTETVVCVDNFKIMLQQMARPYLHRIFINCCKKQQDPRKIVAEYFKNLGLPQYRELTYEHSVFDLDDADMKMLNENSVARKNIFELSNEQRYEFTSKYGFGYTDEELIAIDRKYNALRINYPEHTALHTEALISYCRFRVKEEFATAKGDLTEASKWGDMAQKQATSARINPSQLTKNDLTSGLSGFGELSRAVEQAVDVIPILPRFLSKPQDKVDFTLWCYINYIRNMNNLPDCEYSDVYKFLEERKKDYDQKHNADVDGDVF